MRSKAFSDSAVAVLYLAPALAVLGTFSFFPILYTGYLSFTTWNMMTPTKVFVGLENYVRLLQAPKFHLAVRNTVLFTVVQVGCGLCIGLFLAVLLNHRGRTAYRTAIYTPTVVAMSAVAVLWAWLFDPDFGPINSVLAFLKLPSPGWLGDPKWALWALVIVNVWKNMGYNAVVFLAGLQSIPREVLEAARVDGAGSWTSFWRITFPLLSPTSFFLITVSLIWSFQVFDSVSIMTQGGPMNSTSVVVYYFYQHAFRFFEAGYASATVMVLLLVVVSITYLQTRLAKRWVHYV